ncbi:proline--tRNA ligase [Candidatus Poribacteria bacterium]|nr:proline--tRNA ligase [Candidatus Poribacteria bacterium]
MKMSQLFGRTLRETPAGAEIPSHLLLMRAGMIRPLAAGIYSCLPLAQRSLHKIEQITREEMDAIGGQEINMPLVHPAELWRETGRWNELIGKELIGFKDRYSRDFVLAMTHEESITDLARKEINSYRQLPLMLYQIKLKFRDEERPRAGLIRVREFTMKDAYSFHTDENDLNIYYEKVYQAYLNIFCRCGIGDGLIVVESDPGMMGGLGAHEFMLVTESGEDKLILCSRCDYKANAEVAMAQKQVFDHGEPREIEEVATPGQKTIAEVANYLGVKESQTLKVVFYSTGKEIILVGIRGDLEVNEIKLMNVLKTPDLWIATDEELRQDDLVAGYASPIRLSGIKVVLDDSVPKATNLVAGANKENYHLKNVNYPRDFPDQEPQPIVTDIAMAQDGEECVHCGGRLKAARGIEVGNIFKLGTKYSSAMGATYLDQSGKEHPIVMGCYGIGMGRLMASVVEANHDEDGIIWPLSVTPYQIYLMNIGQGEDVIEQVEKLYYQLQEQGYEVLFDDREESPGVKFKDADLLGMPIRVAVSARTLRENSVEVKLRKEKEKQMVKLDNLNQTLELIFEKLCG